MRKSLIYWYWATALALVAAAATSTGALAKDLRIATLAPDGSAWAKIMAEGGKQISEKTAGRVNIKYFFSGSQGDERDVVRKMKLKHLSGSALTAVGLGLIKSDVRVLELPFLIKNDKELDYIRDKMAPDFEKQFDEAGYVLVAWGDVGWTHLYSNIPINKLSDLNSTKMWAWTDDPIVRAFFKRLGVNGVPLGVNDVKPSLETGAIDACYGAPLVAIVFQWYTKVTHATSQPINYAIGALIVRKEEWAEISAEDQAIVREAGKEMGKKLMASVRKDNERAKKTMQKSNITFDPTPPELVAEFEKQAQGVWTDLSGGKLYSNDLLEKVKKHLSDIRK